MSSATSHPRRRMPRADRERQMLDVAEQIFAERGYQTTSMDEIAERVGVSKPMLYEYFGSKDGLLLASIERCKAELYATTRAATDWATGPRDTLWRGMLAYYEFMEAHSAAFAVLMQAPMALPPSAPEAIESTRRQQSDLIAPILARFVPAAPAQAIEAYTQMIIGASERLALWRAARPQLTAADAARHMTDFCWQGLSRYLRREETEDD